MALPEDRYGALRRHLAKNNDYDISIIAQQERVLFKVCFYFENVRFLSLCRRGKLHMQT